MLELREEVKDTCTLQIIAFPQEGMYAYQGGDKLVEEALTMGADLVGAIPHFEYTREDGVKSVQKAFELAVKYDKMVDIHCDETDDDQSRFIEVLAAEALRSGIAEKATASHTCAMHLPILISCSNYWGFPKSILFPALPKTSICRDVLTTTPNAAA